MMTFSFTHKQLNKTNLLLAGNTLFSFMLVNPSPPGGNRQAVIVKPCRQSKLVSHLKTEASKVESRALLVHFRLKRKK